MFRRRKKVGVALSGGGARALAHIPILEALDAAGIRPVAIAGTSMGAILGAFYAAGHSGGAIRDMVRELLSFSVPSWRDLFRRGNTVKWYELLSPRLGKTGLLDAEGLLTFMDERLGCATFEELRVPLKIVATDFWARREVVFDSGELLPAIEASMAVPGIFRPAVYRGRVLIDGGAVNPVPCDLLPADCDVTIAVNALGTRMPEESEEPGLLEAVFGAFQIMEEAIVTARMRPGGPDIYLQPEIRNVRILEFYKAGEIYRQAAPAVETLKAQLAARGLPH